MIIQCPVSLGELVDKISILKIKTIMIKDKAKVDHAMNEYNHLMKTLSDLKLEGVDSYVNELIEINTELWKIEDDIREEERKKDFSSVFIDLARSVYRTNDRRFAVKNRINDFYGSGLKEVKSYEEY
jgi:hypothetical protein